MQKTPGPESVRTPLRKPRKSPSEMVKTFSPRAAGLNLAEHLFPRFLSGQDRRSHQTSLSLCL